MAGTEVWLPQQKIILDFIVWKLEIQGQNTRGMGFVPEHSVFFRLTVATFAWYTHEPIMRGHREGGEKERWVRGREYKEENENERENERDRERSVLTQPPIQLDKDKSYSLR